MLFCYDTWKARRGRSMRLMKKKTNVQAKTNNLAFLLQKTAVYTTFLFAILMISRASENTNKRTTAFRYPLLLSSPSTPHSLKRFSMYTFFNTFSVRMN